ncbi:MAG: hypothetical protein GQ569_13560 [Methylococcaceae bacterium]|nr:hypothetical protein [Methylococcaceae bacterium]
MMNKLIKWSFTLSGCLLLSACVTNQDYKVQFEPTLPIPFLIVPDEGGTTESYQNDNNQSNDYQDDNYQNNDYQRNERSEQYRNYQQNSY